MVGLAMSIHTEMFMMVAGRPPTPVCCLWRRFSIALCGNKGLLDGPRATWSGKGGRPSAEGARTRRRRRRGGRAPKARGTRGRRRRGGRAPKALRRTIDEGGSYEAPWWHWRPKAVSGMARRRCESVVRAVIEHWRASVAALQWTEV